MPDPAPDFLAILEELTAQVVDFIVIGGVGAALQGAPVTTSISIWSTRARRRM